jgi:hypothetical protein
MTDASAQLPVTANFINPETMHHPAWIPQAPGWAPWPSGTTDDHFAPRPAGVGASLPGVTSDRRRHHR